MSQRSNTMKSTSAMPSNGRTGVRMDSVPVNIAADIYDEMTQYAKRTHCTAETAVNAALAEWLGRM